MAEGHMRSIVKGLTWRFVATITTMTLVFIYTGNITTSLGIGVFDVIAKLMFYYAHERAWTKVTWGYHK